MKNIKPIHKVAIIGLGLMGGSFALEIKKHKLAKKVIGVSRASQNRREALRRNAVDEVHSEIGPYLKEADLIVLATPVQSILQLLSSLRPFLSPEAIVTDVGSTKEDIIKEAKRLRIKHFVGGHPIAGTEKSGMRAAQLDLFKNKKWILTPSQKTRSFMRLAKLLKRMGAEVIIMKASQHDELLASVSHLPNLLAYVLAATVGQKDRKQKIKFAASSLLGMTRVASSPPEMWRDICLSNQVEISKILSVFQKDLAELKKAVDQKNSKKLMALLDQGRSFRKELEKKK